MSCLWTFVAYSRDNGRKYYAECKYFFVYSQLKKLTITLEKKNKEQNREQN